MSIQEFVRQLLKKFLKMKNEEIAAMVRKEFNSKTSAKDISWYRWYFRQKDNLLVSETNADVSTKLETITLDDNDIVDLEESEEQQDELFVNVQSVDLIDEKSGQTNGSLAEAYALAYERSQNRDANIVDQTHNVAPGYDIESRTNGEICRRIEVKAKANGRFTWYQLTSKETEAFLKYPNFYLYLVEGNLITDKENVKLYIIDKESLLERYSLKLEVRFNGLTPRGIKEVPLSNGGWLANTGSITQKQD